MWERTERKNQAVKGVHSNLICGNPKLEITQMPMNMRVDKQIAVGSYNGMKWKWKEQMYYSTQAAITIQQPLRWLLKPASTTDTFIVLKAGSLRSAVGRAGFRRELFSWLAHCPQRAFPCVSVQRESRLPGVSSYKGTNPNLRSPPLWPHLTLITSLRPQLQISSYLGVRASTYEFWGDISVHNSELWIKGAIWMNLKKYFAKWKREHKKWIHCHF